jgi:hypothetical protein
MSISSAVYLKTNGTLTYKKSLLLNFRTILPSWLKVVMAI